MSRKHDDKESIPLEARIGAHLDGELPAAEREQVELLIEREPELHDLACELRGLDRLAGRISPPRVTRGEWDATLEAVRRRAREEPAPAAGDDGVLRFEDEAARAAARRARGRRAPREARGRRAVLGAAGIVAAAGLIAAFLGPGDPSASGTRSSTADRSPSAPSPSAHTAEGRPDTPFDEEIRETPDGEIREASDGEPGASLPRSR